MYAEIFNLAGCAVVAIAIAAFLKPVFGRSK